MLNDGLQDGERNNGVKQKNLECSLDMNLVEHNLYIVQLIIIIFPTFYTQLRLKPSQKESHFTSQLACYLKTSQRYTSVKTQYSLVQHTSLTRKSNGLIRSTKAAENAVELGHIQTIICCALQYVMTIYLCGKTNFFSVQLEDFSWLFLFFRWTYLLQYFIERLFDHF